MQQLKATANWTSAAHVSQHGMPSKDQCPILEKTYHGDVLCLTREYLDEVCIHCMSACVQLPLLHPPERLSVCRLMVACRVFFA